MRAPIFLIALLTVLSGCDGCKPIKPSPKPFQVYIVLCDMSGTTNYSEVRQNIIGHAAEIALRMPVNASVHYLAIEDRDYNRKLMSLTKSMPNVVKPSVQKQILKSFVGYADSVRTTIGKFHPKYEHTCITHAIKRAYEIAKEERARREDVTIKLIILSDMVEECPSNIVGKRTELDFRTGASGSRMVEFDFLTRVEEKLVDFEPLNPDVFVVVESRNERIRYQRQEVLIYRWELEELWLAVFPHFGIDKSRVHFSVAELPSNMFSNRETH